jgi:hypothetical protein
MVDESSGVPVNAPKYLVNPRSIVMLRYDDATREVKREQRSFSGMPMMET